MVLFGAGAPSLGAVCPEGCLRVRQWGGGRVAAVVGVGVGVGKCFNPFRFSLEFPFKTFENNFWTKRKIPKILDGDAIF